MLLKTFIQQNQKSIVLFHYLLLTILVSHKNQTFSWCLFGWSGRIGG